MVAYLSEAEMSKILLVVTMYIGKSSQNTYSTPALNVPLTAIFCYEAHLLTHTFLFQNHLRGTETVRTNCYNFWMRVAISVFSGALSVWAPSIWPLVCGFKGSLWEHGAFKSVGLTLFVVDIWWERTWESQALNPGDSFPPFPISTAPSLDYSVSLDLSDLLPVPGPKWALGHEGRAGLPCSPVGSSSKLVCPEVPGSICFQLFWSPPRASHVTGPDTVLLTGRNEGPLWSLETRNNCTFPRSQEFSFGLVGGALELGAAPVMSGLMTVKGSGDKMPTEGLAQTYRVKMAKRRIWPQGDFFSSHM